MSVMYILALPIALGTVLMAAWMAERTIWRPRPRHPLPLSAARLRRLAGRAHQREALAWMRRQAGRR